MQYAQYGKDGPTVSRLGFGVMRLPSTQGGGWGTVHFRKSVAVIRQALDAGVNFLDSHHNYHGGLSEVAIGKALKGWKGGPVVIQTKTPFYRKEPQRFFKGLIEEALEKLGVNCIDYLFFHSMSMDMFQSRGKKFFALTDWAIKKGYIRHRGFSSHDKPENVKQFIDTGEFAAMLVSYNWQNPLMADTIAYAADKGMGVSVMNPVAGGTLAVDTRPVLRLLPGAKSGPEVALRYVLATPGVTLALSGMNTAEQVAENTAVAARAVPMTPKQRTAFHDRLARIKQKADVICTHCGYCMPCPAGVNIPRNFLALNRAQFFDMGDYATNEFARMRRGRKGDQSALACTACGKCLPKCPNDVDIPQQLREVARRFAAQ
jgi:predicted aldo/keto reductase-like oxidoreductase